MHYALVNFLRNLGAGLRVCTFRRASRLDFRIDYTQLLLLFGMPRSVPPLTSSL
mgnify:CR=1 FL=1